MEKERKVVTYDFQKSTLPHLTLHCERYYLLQRITVNIVMTRNMRAEVQWLQMFSYRRS